MIKIFENKKKNVAKSNIFKASVSHLFLKIKKILLINFTKILILAATMAATLGQKLAHNDSFLADRA